MTLPSPVSNNQILSILFLQLKIFLKIKSPWFTSVSSYLNYCSDILTSLPPLSLPPLGLALERLLSCPTVLFCELECCASPCSLRNEVQILQHCIQVLRGLASAPLLESYLPQLTFISSYFKPDCLLFPGKTLCFFISLLAVHSATFLQARTCCF